MTASSEDPSSDEEIDLRAVAAAVSARYWWVVISVVICTAAFTAAAFLMTPIYRASTVVVDASSTLNGMGGGLASTLGQLGGLASLAGINMNPGGNPTEEALAVMRSREFTEHFIRDLQLLPELFYKRWDADRKQWKGDAKDTPTLVQGFRYFDTNVRNASQDRKTGLISIQIEWKDPVKAAEWANLLVERLNNEMRSRAIDKTNASVGYLEKELAATPTVEIRQAINRLIETQINQRMLANVTHEYAFRVVDRALPPDPRNITKPNRLLLLVLGPVLGLLIGAFAALIAGAFAARGKN